MGRPPSTSALATRLRCGCQMTGAGSVCALSAPHCGGWTRCALRSGCRTWCRRCSRDSRARPSPRGRLMSWWSAHWRLGGSSDGSNRGVKRRSIRVGSSSRGRFRSMNASPEPSRRAMSPDGRAFRFRRQRPRAGDGRADHAPRLRQCDPDRCWCHAARRRGSCRSATRARRAGWFRGPRPLHRLRRCR